MKKYERKKLTKGKKKKSVGILIMKIVTVTFFQ